MPDDDVYLSAWNEWRTHRLAELVKPDGWLSVTGLVWLEPGTWRIGSSPDNDIAIENLPASAGTIVDDEAGEVRLILDPSAEVQIEGRIDRPPTTEVLLSADPSNPTIARFGTVSFFVIERDGRKALRVKDNDRKRQLVDIPYFPPDPSWRIEAEWRPLSEPRRFEVDNVVGGPTEVLVANKAVFRRGDQTFELFATHGTRERPMFVLRDGTSGKTTYGASRFLIGEIRSDTIVLDFNRAYNPPCAFTDHATCPLPPSENRLALDVTAGEKTPVFGG